jgi:hypothetical protein
VVGGIAFHFLFFETWDTLRVPDLVPKYKKCDLTFSVSSPCS